MDIITGILIFVLEILKWVILANVLLSWLPLLISYIPPYHPISGFLRQVLEHPITDLVRRIAEPILRPLRRFSQFGPLDLSPIIAFVLIIILQSILRGGLAAIADIIAKLLVITIAFTIHEFAHAFVALQLGDRTAKYQGRLTLDPRRHLDVFGTLALMAFGFGWAKPVPVNPNALRSGPKVGMAIVALAGPVSNLILAGIGAFLYNLIASGSVGPPAFPLSFVMQVIYQFIFINVLLFFFNLLPIAPLDGFKVLAGLLPYPTSASFQRLEPAGPIILLLLLVFGRGLLNVLVGLPTTGVTNLLVL